MLRHPHPLQRALAVAVVAALLAGCGIKGPLTPAPKPDAPAAPAAPAAPEDATKGSAKPAPRL